MARVEIGARMPYWFRIDGRMVTRGSLQEVQAAVANYATTLLATDPATFAADAQALNLAFQSGAVEEAIDVWGDWGMTVGEDIGSPVRLQVTKEEEQ
jgi:hypothetical protein